MPIISRKTCIVSTPAKGFSLIELIVFIVVISIALVGLLSVYQQSVVHSVDPIRRIRILTLAQARLDQILALRYDAATPTGGIPACGSSAIGALPCTNTPDANMDDVDDYNGVVDTPFPGYTRTVQVANLGANFAKLITVKVTAPGGEVLTLAAYRINF